MNISALSTEFVHVPLTALGDDPPDPATLNVDLAFVTQGVEPTWLDAAWDADTQTYRVLVGPGDGVVELEPGSYGVMVRITDAPETPVLWAGVLTVYGGDVGDGDPYVSAAQAFSGSPLLRAAFAPGEGTEELTSLLVAASLLVGSLTCRSLVEGQEGTAVPDALAPLARRAVLLKAEQMNVRGGTVRARRGAVDSGRLQSFSAGPYSESYFGPDQAMKAKQLDPDGAIHEVLWALATDECRAAWLDLWEGRVEPAAAVLAFDWNRRPGGYSDYSYVPPDGW